MTSGSIIRDKVILSAFVSLVVPSRIVATAASLPINFFLCFGSVVERPEHSIISNMSMGYKLVESAMNMLGPKVNQTLANWFGRAMANELNRSGESVSTNIILLSCCGRYLWQIPQGRSR